MSEPPVNKTARWLQNYSLRVVHLPVKEKAMSEPKPLKVLTSADDVLDVMMEHYVDGDFGYFREGDASAAIWACVEATIAAQNARIADIEYELSDAQKLYERFRDAEKRLSSSYVNLRRILGTLDIDYEGVSDMWAKTEAAARGAVTRIEELEREVRELSHYRTLWQNREEV